MILGSGNTAFQLANIAVSHGLNTTILAREYLGIFPQETKNRFALRAPSQITIEKFGKVMTLKIQITCHSLFTLHYILMGNI